MACADGVSFAVLVESFRNIRLVLTLQLKATAQFNCTIKKVPTPTLRLETSVGMAVMYPECVLFLHQARHLQDV